MKKKDRRKNPRTDICNPISYFCMDKDGHILDQHTGVAFNISQSGIGIETGLKIESDYILLNFIDLQITEANYLSNGEKLINWNNAGYGHQFP